MGPESQAPWRIPQWFNDLSPGTLNLLKSYHNLLLKFGSKINLVSARTLWESDFWHLSDAIIACRIILGEVPSGATVWDIGSGNGLPGIVLGVLNPSIKIALVEVDRRKGEFLRTVIQELGLDNTEVIIQDVFSLSNPIEWGVSRGFAPLARALISLNRIFQKEEPISCLKATNG